MIEWSDAMKARLLSLVKDKMSYPQIAATMSREFKKSFGKNACIGKARRLLKPDKAAPRFAQKPKPKPRPVKLQGLTPQTCRWPLGTHLQHPPYLYCGDNPVHGSPYCPTHHRISYTR